MHSSVRVILLVLGYIASLILLAAAYAVPGAEPPVPPAPTQPAKTKPSQPAKDQPTPAKPAQTPPAKPAPAKAPPAKPAPAKPATPQSTAPQSAAPQPAAPAPATTKPGSAPATEQTPAQPAAQTAVQPPVASAAQPSPAAMDAAFAKFVTDFRATALAAGITPETYDAAMKGVTRNQRITDHNLNQPEFARAIWDYLDAAVSPQRIADGRALLAADDAILTPISAKYGVPKEILVSIWGNESNYGKLMGTYNMFQALATLAYDGPRAEYGRTQLLAALKMMQQQKYAPADMTSSWAGAFGQTQFVPTTFLAEAVDGDGDGKIDLWHSAADTLASAANVISNAGWKDGKPWGYEVVLPKTFAYENADLDDVRPVADWSKLGVRTVSWDPLPASDEPAALYLPAGARGPAFLVFPNFKTILKYNNAASYALAVCLLADQLKGKPPVSTFWPRDESPLNRDERIALQASLAKLGFDVGKIDGLIGGRSRAAIRAWQKAHNIPADGYATPELLTRIAMDAKSTH